MFADLIRPRMLVVAATLPPLMVIVFFAMGEWNRRSAAPMNLTGSSGAGGSSVEFMKESLSRDRRLLVQYEQEQATLRAEVIRLRKVFQAGQASKEQVGDVEKSFVAALRRVHETRYSVEETDIAITEAVLGEKVLRMPELPVNGFSETAELARFNGGSKWSLKEAPRVGKYFSQALVAACRLRLWVSRTRTIAWVSIIMMPWTSASILRAVKAGR